MKRLLLLLLLPVCWVYASGRLLVSVDQTAGFSPEEFAEATSALLVEADSRNPFMAVHAVSLNHPFVVVSNSLDCDLLERVARRYGYRCVQLTDASLPEGISTASRLLEVIPQRSSQIPYLSADEADQIYALMKKVDALFLKNGISYWATAGTLLGAIRHGGLIPWDDDLDICILEKDERKLLELEADLVRMDLELHYCSTDAFDFYKIYPRDGLDIDTADGEDRPWKYPYVDVFVVALERNHEFEDIYVHRSPRCYQYFHKEKFHYSQIAHPTRAPFGPISISVPHDAESFLDACFGTPSDPSLWSKYAVEPSYDHKRETALNKGQGTALVEIDDYLPAHGR